MCVNMFLCLLINYVYQVVTPQHPPSRASTILSLISLMDNVKVHMSHCVIDHNHNHSKMMFMYDSYCINCYSVLMFTVCLSVHYSVCLYLET